MRRTEGSCLGLRLQQLGRNHLYLLPKPYGAVLREARVSPMRANVVLVGYRFLQVTQKGYAFHVLTSTL